MPPLGERILEQLGRRGPLSAATVTRIFDVSEEEASAAIDELLKTKLVHRINGRIFASVSSRSQDTASAPSPAGQQRQIQDAPTAPPRAPLAPSSDRARRDQVASVSRPEVIASAVPRETQESSAMADKVCSGECGESKPATAEFFYRHPSTKDGFDGVCKACKSKAGKARRKKGAKGPAAAPEKKPAAKTARGGVRAPKSPAPAPAANGAGAEPGAPGIKDLAVMQLPSGFRLGPLHKTLGSLSSMPFWVDLSFAQLDELHELRKAAK